MNGNIILIMYELGEPLPTPGDFAELERRIAESVDPTNCDPYTAQIITCRKERGELIVEKTEALTAREVYGARANGFIIDDGCDVGPSSDPVSHTLKNCVAIVRRLEQERYREPACVALMANAEALRGVMDEAAKAFQAIGRAVQQMLPELVKAFNDIACDSTECDKQPATGVRRCGLHNDRGTRPACVSAQTCRRRPTQCASGYG